MMTEADLRRAAGRSASAPRFYGKYRGKVLENIDPLFLGRISASVPAVSDMPTGWALPCTPYAGLQVGLYLIPPIGANVWIEFEGGDPDYPIWTGCFWEEGEVPLEAPPPGMSILKTECITLILNDEPGAGGVTLEVIEPAVETPLTITINSTGIEIVTEELVSITCNTMSVEAEAELNLTSAGVISTEAEETNITSEALTVEAEEFNIASEALTIEAEETNLTGAAFTIETEETNLTSGAFTVETEETNIASLAVTTESLETNILSPAITVEGLVEVTGDLLIDGQQPLVI